MANKEQAVAKSKKQGVTNNRPEIFNLASTNTAKNARNSLLKAERIAVLTKFRFMGDTIVATPFLKQLRHYAPSAEIHLLTAPSVVAALANCPYVNDVIEVNVQGQSRWQHGQELFTMLREGRYQVGFILNRSLHCAVTCTLARLSVRIGYANESLFPFLTVPIPYYFDRNEVDCHLDMLRAIGLPAQDALPELWFTECERQRAKNLLSSYGVDLERPVLGIQPGANDPHIREWGPERYARVGDILAKEMDANIILMGGTGERDTAERMEAAIRQPSINLVGAFELRDALAVIGLCDLWLGNDTGLLHAAVAQRVASVGLFGPNKVVRWGYDTPRHRSLVFLPPEPARDDASVRRCLDAITEEQVLSAARSVLCAPESEEEVASLDRLVLSESSKRAPYFAATLEPSRLIPTRRR